MIRDIIGPIIFAAGVTALLDWFLQWLCKWWNWEGRELIGHPPHEDDEHLAEEPGDLESWPEHVNKVYPNENWLKGNGTDFADELRGWADRKWKPKEE